MRLGVSSFSAKGLFTLLHAALSGDKMRSFCRYAPVLVGAVSLLAAQQAWAQAPNPEAPSAADPGAADEQNAELNLPPFPFVAGPVEGKLGDIATIAVPEGMSFVAKQDMPALNQATGNLHNPNDVGAILAEQFILFFSFDNIGYVKDDEKDELDADDLLESFQKGQEQSNEQRRNLGMVPLHIIGWQTPPFYDATTHNLTWATKLSADGEEGFNINHNVRLLGRSGVMSVTLVASPENITIATAALDQLLKDYAFVPGAKYAEFKQGDRIAEYGLTALMLGGGVALAAKTGLLAKLGKFIKVIVIGVVALVGGIANFFKSKFGHRTN